MSKTSETTLEEFSIDDLFSTIGLNQKRYYDAIYKLKEIVDRNLFALLIEVSNIIRNNVIETIIGILYENTDIEEAARKGINSNIDLISRLTKSMVEYEKEKQNDDTKET